MARNTSNTNNTGIMHARLGSRVLCGRRNAIMAADLEKFRTVYADCQCKRCATKLAEMEQNGKRKLVGTVDITPTWAGVLPLYLAALADGTPAAQASARDELAHMARLADAAA